jgi:GNAT superfamily N-acetyltransferase
LPTPTIRPPEPLGPEHHVLGFANGRHASLDHWLHHRARDSEGLSARTYVACLSEPAHLVVGYYAIATATAQRVAIPNAKLRKGMPQEVPLMLLGRLAVDHAFQGRGLGSALLLDALRRCAAVSAIAGARGVITHAIDEQAAGFYARHGFMAAQPLGERTMLIPIEVLRATFAKS